MGCGCSGNSPKHCWELSPGPVPGAAGLSSLHTGQKLLILCQHCLPHGSDTVPPQVGTQRESPPSAGDTRSPLQVLPGSEAFSCAKPKDNCRRFLHPAAGTRPGNSGAAESSHFPRSSERYRKAQGDGDALLAGMAAELGWPGLGGDWGCAAKPLPLARGRASARGMLMPCAPGGSSRSRDGKGDLRQHACQCGVRSCLC